MFGSFNYAKKKVAVDPKNMEQQLVYTIPNANMALESNSLKLKPIPTVIEQLPSEVKNNDEIDMELKAAPMPTTESESIKTVKAAPIQNRRRTVAVDKVVQFNLSLNEIFEYEPNEMSKSSKHRLSGGCGSSMRAPKRRRCMIETPRNDAFDELDAEEIDQNAELQNQNEKPQIKDEHKHTQLLNEHEKLLSEIAALQEGNQKLLDENRKSLEENTKLKNEYRKLQEDNRKLMNRSEKSIKENAELLQSYRKLLDENKKSREEKTKLQIEHRKLLSQCGKPHQVINKLQETNRKSLNENMKLLNENTEWFDKYTAVSDQNFKLLAEVGKLRKQNAELMEEKQQKSSQYQHALDTSEHSRHRIEKLCHQLNLKNREQQYFAEQLKMKDEQNQQIITKMIENCKEECIKSVEEAKKKQWCTQCRSQVDSMVFCSIRCQEHCV